MSMSSVAVGARAKPAGGTSSTTSSSSPQVPEVTLTPYEIQNQMGVAQVMGELFAGVEGELRTLIDFGNKLDFFYSLHMLVDMEGVLAIAQARSPYLVSMAATLQKHLKLLFNSFIAEEEAWILSTKTAAKRAGVLEPFLKFPVFVNRMEEVVRGVRSAAADATYYKLSRALFQLLEQVARQDSKYSDVVFMENLHYFWTAFSHRAVPVPALEQSLARALEGFQTHLATYVRWSVSYEMPSVTGFWDRLDAELATTAPEDVAFTAGLSKHDLRALTNGPLVEVELAKSVAQMYARAQKHLPKNLLLLGRVWKEITAYFCDRFVRFERLVEASYENEPLRIDLRTIQGIFAQVQAQIDAACAVPGALAGVE